MASLKIKIRDLTMYRKQTTMVLAAALLSALPALSQESGLYRNEFTAQASGSFLKTTNDNGSQQSATNSGGVLGSYRLFFNGYNGVEVNYGYTLNTQTYVLPASSIGVKSYSHEISGAYVIRKPLKRWSPFALAGVGGLIFDPKDTPGVNSQARAAFLYGGGADITLSAHWYVRAEYRGFVYNSPTWNLQGVSGAGRVTHLAEPSIGFGYRF
jgi:opacity protein-like surface antigen